jgi:hypothetical protein
LDFYTGNLFIGKNAVLKHRISKYKSVEKLFDKFEHIIVRNTQIKTIIKGEMKLCYSEPHEREQVFDDCEWINKQSDMTPT